MGLNTIQYIQFKYFLLILNYNFKSIQKIQNMQVTKFRKNICNLQIPLKTKELLLRQTNKYRRKGVNTSNLSIKNNQDMNNNQWKIREQLQDNYRDNSNRISRSKFLKLVSDQKIKQNVQERKTQKKLINNQQQILQKNNENMGHRQTLNLKKQNLKSNPLYLNSSYQMQESRKVQFMKIKPTYNTNTKEDIIKICLNCFIICSNIIKSRNLKQAQIIMVFIDKTLSDICSQADTYLWKMMRVRIILLKTELIMAKLEFNCMVSKKQLQMVLRLPLFCRELQKDIYYSILSEDYYSFIEIIYLNALNSFTLQNNLFKNFTNSVCLSEKRKSMNYHLITVNMIKNKKLIEQLIQNCRVCLIKQLQKLCRILTQISDKKIFHIITLKCETLLKLYGFELVFIYIYDRYYQNVKKNHSQESSMEIKSNKIGSQQSSTTKNEQQKQLNQFHRLNQVKKNEQKLREDFQRGKTKIWNKYQNIFKLVPNSLSRGEIQEKVFHLFQEKISFQFGNQEQSCGMFLNFSKDNDQQSTQRKDGEQQKTYSFLDEHNRHMKEEQNFLSEYSDQDLYQIGEIQSRRSRKRRNSRRPDQNQMNFGQKNASNQILTIYEEEEYLINYQQCAQDTQSDIKQKNKYKKSREIKTIDYLTQQKLCSSHEVSMGKSNRSMKRKNDKNLLFVQIHHPNDQIYKKNQKVKKRHLSFQHNNNKFPRPSIKIHQAIQLQDNKNFSQTSNSKKQMISKLSIENKQQKIQKKNKKVMILSQFFDNNQLQKNIFQDKRQKYLPRKSQNSQKSWNNENLLKDMQLNMNKVQLNRQKQKKKYQSEQVRRVESVGKRIYRMEIFKMALAAAPMRQKIFPLQINKQKQLISSNFNLSPETRTKKCKSLNKNCQKYVTFIPRLINIEQKKRQDKKLVLNR